jgi:hypothetical protein
MPIKGKGPDNTAIQNHFNHSTAGLVAGKEFKTKFSGKEGTFKVTESAKRQVFNPSMGQTRVIRAGRVTQFNLKGAQKPLLGKYKGHVEGEFRKSYFVNLEDRRNNFASISAAIDNSERGSSFCCQSLNGQGEILGIYSKEGRAISFSKEASLEETVRILTQKRTPLADISNLYFSTNNAMPKHVKRSNVADLAGFRDIFSSNADIIRFEEANGSALHFTLTKTLAGTYQFSGNRPTEAVVNRILNLADALGKRVVGLERRELINNIEGLEGAFNSNADVIRLDSLDVLTPGFSLTKIAEGTYQFSGNIPTEIIGNRILDLAGASGKVISGLERRERISVKRVNDLEGNLEDIFTSNKLMIKFVDDASLTKATLIKTSEDRYLFSGSLNEDLIAQILALSAGAGKIIDGLENYVPFALELDGIVFEEEEQEELIVEEETVNVLGGLKSAFENQANVIRFKPFEDEASAFNLIKVPDGRYTFDGNASAIMGNKILDLAKSAGKEVFGLKRSKVNLTKRMDDLESFKDIFINNADSIEFKREGCTAQLSKNKEGYGLWNSQNMTEEAKNKVLSLAKKANIKISGIQLEKNLDNLESFENIFDPNVPRVTFNGPNLSISPTLFRKRDETYVLFGDFEDEARNRILELARIANKKVHDLMGKTEALNTAGITAGVSSRAFPSSDS